MKKILFSMFLSLCMIFSCLSVTAFAADSNTIIELSDSGVTVDGSAASTDSTSAVYVGADIVYYEDGTDDSYGDGSENDMHTAEEAQTHTVVMITQPGSYEISGTLSAGQIAVDLGEDAQDDPDAVVTLILNGVDITCTVAPAIVFYNAYECCATDAEDAVSVVDTSEAGANIIIADDTTNNITGSYVAKIYEEGTTSKLYKFDGTIHARMSMNVGGETNGTGVLNIYAENEGLDSDINLTVNGGNINIYAGNDGINTSEDEVSVFTMNDGYIYVENTGETGEGDGIDSNGWIVINGGTIIAGACESSQDSGVDSDLGITINGGTVLAYGSMYDEMESETQPFVMLSFSQTQSSDVSILMCDENGDTVAVLEPASAFSILVYTSPELVEGNYSFYLVDTDGNNKLLSGSATVGMMGGEMPEGFEPPEDGEMPEGFEPPEDGEMPEGFEPPEDGEMPEGFEPPEDGEMPEAFDSGGMSATNVETIDLFTISIGGNLFYNISTSAATYTGLPFSDIANTDSYYEAVKYFYDNGIMIGTSDTAFSPDGALTRAMAITVLGRLSEVEQTESSEFTDVESGLWYSGYIGWAESNGIVEGYGDGTFGPYDTLTAQQLELILSRYAELTGLEYNVDETAGNEAVSRGVLAEKLYTLYSEQIMMNDAE